jgi:hypothetical protein
LCGDRLGGDRLGEDGSGGEGSGKNRSVGDGSFRNGSVAKKVAADHPSFNWFNGLSCELICNTKSVAKFFLTSRGVF